MSEHVRWEIGQHREHVTGEPYIATETATHVAEFLAELRPRPEFNPPTVVPTFDGDAQIEWHEHGVDIEVYVGHDGVYDLSYSGPRMELAIDDLLYLAVAERPALPEREGRA